MRESLMNTKVKYTFTYESLGLRGYKSTFTCGYPRIGLRKR